MSQRGSAAARAHRRRHTIQQPEPRDVTTTDSGALCLLYDRLNRDADPSSAGNGSSPGRAIGPLASIDASCRRSGRRWHDLPGLPPEGSDHGAGHDSHAQFPPGRIVACALPTANGKPLTCPFSSARRQVGGACRLDSRRGWRLLRDERRVSMTAAAGEPRCRRVRTRAPRTRSRRPTHADVGHAAGRPGVSPTPGHRAVGTGDVLGEPGARPSKTGIRNVVDENRP